MRDLTWVTRTITVDAVGDPTLQAIEANPGWRLLGVGVGLGGQTTLTFGWPWEGEHEGRPDDGDLREAVMAFLAAWESEAEANGLELNDLSDDLHAAVVHLVAVAAP